MPRLIVPNVTFHAVVRYSERVLGVDIKRERRLLTLTHKWTGDLDLHLAAAIAGRGYDVVAIGSRLGQMTEPARRYGAGYMTLDGVRFILDRSVLVTVFAAKRRWYRKRK
jgi:hypothetical protein